VRRAAISGLIYSLALGTGLRLAEIVGLNVGDVYGPDMRPEEPGPAQARDRQERPGRRRVPSGCSPAKFGNSGATRPRGTKGYGPRTRCSARRAASASHTAASSSPRQAYPFQRTAATQRSRTSTGSRGPVPGAEVREARVPASPPTVYTHPSDQEMWEKVRRLSC